MSRLGMAIKLAADIHLNQVDKGGEPYILHALAVMNSVDLGGRWFGFEERENLMIVAVLHDSIEDFEGGPGERAEFRQYLLTTFGHGVYDALCAMTRNRDEDYLNVYIERIALNPIARRVKIADLTHNMDTGRLPDRDIGERDYVRWDKYRRALVRLKRED